MSVVQEPIVKWSPDQMVEVVLGEPDDFLKVRETLTRIGVASRKEKKIYQSCHILHKQGRYYLVHFKELFALDGKHANITVNDVQRRNRIAQLLADWGLISIVDADKIQDIAPLNQIKVLAFRDKQDWILETKYNIGSSGKIDAGILATFSDVAVNDLLKNLKEKNFPEVRKWVVSNMDNDTTVLLRRIYDALYVSLENNSVPADDTFVQFGNFSDLKKIIQSNLFYPTFITGLSGNGKTLSVEQACSQTKRELIRVNITIETDEDDLIGGFRLVNGNTVWHNGPVIEALERGAILLLDEIDLASNKILCLQSILEGKGVFLKKIGKWIEPVSGFNVIATANTKGKGSDDGRFIGTNVLNEAFLERFPVTFEQEYPTPSIKGFSRKVL